MKINYVSTAAAAVLLCLTLSDAAPLSAVAANQQVALDAVSSQVTPHYILYKTAHMTTQAGSILDADELRAYVGAGNQLSQATATGHVKAFVNDTTNSRKYTITADSAVFDPKLNTIDLTGNVKAVIVSPFTTGPLTQTGTSATIQLGKAPDYPQIVMRQVHTQFDVKQ